jgi:hypothetical protein
VLIAIEIAIEIGIGIGIGIGSESVGTRFDFDPDPDAPRQSDTPSKLDSSPQVNQGTEGRGGLPRPSALGPFAYKRRVVAKLASSINH